MKKLPVCPHCGSRNVEKKEEFYICRDCQSAFGRKPLADDGTDLVDAVTGMRFRFGDIVSDSIRLRFVQDGEVALYEVYDAKDGGLNKYAGVLGEAEWKELKRKMLEDLFVYDWDRYYIPVNDGRDLRDLDEWSFNLMVNDNEDYEFSGVDEYPVYWKQFKKLIDPFFKKIGEN